MNDETTSRRRRCFAFLADPATHGGETVKRIDTHAASVFLAGERVLKVKRAVKFPFLDYSTLAKRKAACEAEIAVNRAVRAASSIAASSPSRATPTAGSRSAATASRSNGRSRWCASTRTARSIISPTRSTTRSPTRSAAPSRRRTPRPRAVEAEPWIAALGSYIDEHVEAFRRASRDFSAPRRSTRSRARAAPHYDRIVPLLRERGRRGLIRRIHGDLHLGNIVLIDGKPVLFDAIEFSDIIASGDVLYDLAFLLMDLLERGLAARRQHRAQPLSRRDAARRGFRRRSRRCRSISRCARRSAPRSPPRGWSERSQRSAPTIARAAKAYFDFARRAIAPPAPSFVAVGGLSGTGKSQLARALAPHVDPMPGAVIVRSDVERKALFGIAETDKLAGRGLYARGHALASTPRSPTRRAASSRPAIRSSSMRCSRAPSERAAIADAATIRWRRAPRPVSHRRSRHPHRARRRRAHATPPTPTPRSRARRRTTTSARSTGPRSTPRARRRRRSSGAASDRRALKASARSPPEVVRPR